MLAFVDNFLNRITTYRLILYYLIALFAVALFFGVLGILPYSPVSLVISSLIIVLVCWATNEIFARVFRAHVNAESFLITALILVLLITPSDPRFFNPSFFGFLVLASASAMASKYILAIGKKHIFNPAAFAVALTYFAISQSASWWAGGNASMLPFVVIGGLLVVRKIQRFDLVFSFLAVSIVAGVFTLPAQSYLVSLKNMLLYTPIFYFAFVMLTEPLTTPPTRLLRIVYGALVGFLFVPGVHLGSFYFTPELALVAGNVFSYLVSPKGKHVLKLRERKKIALDVCDFVWTGGEKIKFRPGQYMEWTLSHASPDSRGNRRYFTIASSPTEKEIILGTKFNPQSSTFKKAMLAMKPGDEIVGGQLAGEFTLPTDTNKKLAFLAGGIGITPFRSMAKYLSDKNERRDAILLYSIRELSEIAYGDIFDEAAGKAGLKTIYVLTGGGEAPAGINARAGTINKEMLEKEIPDYLERIFYVSGPYSMVKAMEKALREAGVGKNRVKTDFFPGFA